MVVNSVIILRLNMLLSFPFTCLSSRWVLKAWSHLLTDYWLNWDPVKNNNKPPRSLKGVSVLFFLPRSHGQSRRVGPSLPHPGWVTQPCQQQLHVLSEALPPLKSGGICHYLLKRDSKILRTEFWQGSEGHGKVRFLLLSFTWTLRESRLPLCRCLSSPVTVESCLRTFQQDHLKHLYNS